MNRRVIIIAIVLLLLGGGWYWWKSQTSNLHNSIKIGVILPLTGEAANFGQQLKKGIELAFEEFKKSNNSSEVSLYFEDDKGDPSTGIKAYTKLTSIDKVNMIIGPMFSNVALAIAPLTEKDSVVVLSPTASAIELSNYGDHFFRIYPSDSFDGLILSNFIKDKLKKDKISILAADAASTKAITEVFKNNLEAKGAKIVNAFSYLPNNKSFKTVLESIKKDSSDVVFLPGYLDDILTILKYSKELNMNKIFVSISTVYDKKLIEIGKNTVEGLIFSAPYFDVNSKEKTSESFVKSFRNKFKIEPDILAGYGFDALNISIRASLNAKDLNPNSIATSLYSTIDFETVTGKTEFDKNGDVVKQLKIMKVQNGTFIEY